MNDHARNVHFSEGFMELLDKQFKVNVNGDRASFIPFFKKIIEDTTNGIRVHQSTEQPYSKNTINAYRTILNHHLEFGLKSRTTHDFQTVNVKFYCDYTEFLIKTLRLTSNSTGKDIKIIKAVMNEATKRGINRSGNNLFERLENQLCRNYLRDSRSNRCIFCLFIVEKKNFWELPNGNSKANFFELIMSLQEYWDQIACNYPKIEQIKVIGIDLTKRSS